MNLEPLLRRAESLAAAGQGEAARDLLLASAAKLRGNIDGLGLLVYLLLQTKSFERAVFYAEELLALVPGNPEAMANLGTALYETRAFARALPLLRRAVELMGSHPGSAIARAHLCSCLGEMGHFVEMREVAREGIALSPQTPPLHGLRALACSRLGLAAEGLAAIERAVALAPGNIEFESTRCVMRLYTQPVESDDPTSGTALAQLDEAVRCFGRSMVQRYGPSAEMSPLPLRPGGKIRVGFVGPDFRAHAVANFLLPLIERLDKAKFEVFLYSTASEHDRVTERFREHASALRHVHGWTYVKLAEAIREAHLHILIDTASHSKNNALPVFVKRAAPIQLTFCGMPLATGLPSMDCLITDSITWPYRADRDAESPEFSSRQPGVQWGPGERPVMITPHLQVYQPIHEPPRIAHRPSADGHIRFASLSAPMKFSDPLLKSWASILDKVPGATLLVRHEGLRLERERAFLADRMAQAGIRREAISILAPLPPGSGLMDVYNEVDVALDTFPYTGTTTLCEVLQMGVPVVTLCGPSMPNRVGASILQASGRGDWVAHSIAEYVEIAVRHAKAHGGQAAAETQQSRMAARAAFGASPMCDATRYARSFEKLLGELVSGAGVVAAG